MGTDAIEVAIGAPGATAPRIDPAVLETVRAQVADLAEATVSAIEAEVPGFRGWDGPFSSELLEDAVRMVYDGFLGVLADGDPDGTTLARARRGAYGLGRSEARAHRSIDVLLGAYRIGSRVHWQHLANAVTHQMTAEQVAELAAFVFAYSDHLAAASVAGHADETASESHERARRREHLTHALLDGEPVDVLLRRAEQAQWPVPATLTVVLLPAVHATAVILDPRTALTVPVEDPGLRVDDLVAVLVPDAHHNRARLLSTLGGRAATVGPSRAWHDASTSYRRALRAVTGLHPSPHGDPLDTDEHLSELLLLADPDALADLRHRVLAPLADLPAETAHRLGQTLRSWLLHQGRRAKVAADLHVHPQTVRYRMTQILDRFADRLDDPDQVLALILALASPDTAAIGATAAATPPLA